MIDQMFDRSYQHGRAELNAGAMRVFKRIGRSAAAAFRVLNSIEYDSPWLAPRRKGRRA